MVAPTLLGSLHVSSPEQPGLENFLMSSDQQHLFTAVESSFTNILHKQKVIHIRKFSVLNTQQNKVLATSASDSKKFVPDLSKYVLTDSEERVFRKVVKFYCSKSTF
jgi:hypothetical protein